jgi:LysR family glycine cleavage system transcriptional activator
LEALQDPYDVIIRGGPDSFYGYEVCPFLSEQRPPVCSPALLDRLPLQSPSDLQPDFGTTGSPKLASPTSTGSGADPRSLLSHAPSRSRRDWYRNGTNGIGIG